MAPGALIAGDYLTAAAGPRAGQLGPWARIISKMGFEPRSTPIKLLHIFLGLAWLIGILVFLFNPALSFWIFLFCGIGTLWYLPIGTVLSLIVIALAIKTLGNVAAN